MSLADELLADLEELGDGVVKTEPDDVKIKTEPGTEDVQMSEVGPLDDAAKLYGSEKLETIMAAIDECLENPRAPGSILGAVEADPEYQLIVEANSLTVEVDTDISSLHKFVRDRYSKRFPELESLVPTPLEYLMTAKELGNDLDSAKNNPVLAQYITQATIMVLSVTASTTQGVKLEEDELEIIRQACVRALDMQDCKTKIFQYVESRMSFIAPNLSQVVGPATAAQLMGVAGGLTNLSKMPACNVQLLGQQKKILSGFSQVATLPNTGYIYYAPTVQNLPPDLRRKAARVLAAKCTLAARVDACHESPDGSQGRTFREMIEKKYDKWQEPPPVKAVKPLPAPIEQPRKKRGGKRVRRMKEKYAQTELRKQANRMNFGEIEDDAYQDDLGLSLGQIKKSRGSLRGPVVDDRSKVKISKSLQRSLQKANAFASATPAGAATAVIRTGSTLIGNSFKPSHHGKSSVAGTASSVAFTPLQGLEIVNPHAAEKRGDDSSAKYFSSTAGFVNVRK